MKSTLKQEGFFTDRKSAKVARVIKIILLVIGSIAIVAIYLAIFHWACIASVHAYNSIPNVKSKVAILSFGGFVATIATSTKGLLY